ncbi:MAG: Uma2 family endonuclease [Promicromonosporaceae bacterium]|nr:Uma2 family endonuclease [Promicromonosporaceae bacterium]
MVLESLDKMGHQPIPELRGYEGPWPPPEELRRRRMSFEEFARTPWEGNAEWVDGEAIFMIGFPPRLHARVIAKIVVLYASAFPELDVLPEQAVRLNEETLRKPDVVLDHHWTEQDLLSDNIDAPLVVVEVVSKSTRTQDYIDKAAEYAQAGIGQYWIVDWQVETITILRNDDGAWRTLAELTREEPIAEVSIADVGSVIVDLNEII